MSKEERIKYEVEQTLQSLDSLEQSRPRPFFYTRLEARLERESEQSESNVLDWLLKPRVQLAAFFLLVLLNVGAMGFHWNHAGQITEDRSSLIESFGNEYSLNSSGDLYSTENE